MKKLISALMLFSSFSAFSVGHEFNCKEIVEGKRSVSQPTYSIKLKDYQEITRQHPQGRQFEAVYKTRIQLTEKIGSRSTSQSFEAISVTEDVMYMTEARNFRFRAYMDELDQSSITFLKNGKRVHVSMDCN